MLYQYLEETLSEFWNALKYNSVNKSAYPSILARPCPVLEIMRRGKCCERAGGREEEDKGEGESRWLQRAQEHSTRAISERCRR